MPDLGANVAGAALAGAAAIVKRFEGCRLRAYRDIAQFWTIGWGHLMTRDRAVELGDTVITQPEADMLLDQDLAPAAAAVRRLLPVPLTPGAAAALMSFTFNLGAGTLQRSTLRQKLLRGEYEDAADELLRYVIAGGKVSRGLQRRRAAERVLFLS